MIEEEEEDDGGTVVVAGPHSRSFSRKPPHIYSVADDIALLKEVLIHKPFGKCNKKWNIIHKRCRIPVKNGQALKRRLTSLEENFERNNRKCIQRSGEEDDYNEKDRLLQALKDIPQSSTTGYLSSRAQNSTNESERDIQKLQNMHDRAMLPRKRRISDTSDDTQTEKDAFPQKLTRIDYMTLLTKFDELAADTIKSQVDFEDRRLLMQEKEIALREQELKRKADKDAHNHEIERRRIEIEEKRMANEMKKTEIEAEEKMIVLQLLQATILKKGE